MTVPIFEKQVTMIRADRIVFFLIFLFHKCEQSAKLTEAVIFTVYKYSTLNGRIEIQSCT